MGSWVSCLTSYGHVGMLDFLIFISLRDSSIHCNCTYSSTKHIDHSFGSYHRNKWQYTKKYTYWWHSAEHDYRRDQCHSLYTHTSQSCSLTHHWLANSCHRVHLCESDTDFQQQFQLTSNRHTCHAQNDHVTFDRTKWHWYQIMQRMAVLLVCWQRHLPQHRNYQV